MTRPFASPRAECAAFLAAAILCISVAGAAWAGSEIHRCSSTDGVTYTDRGCDGNAQASLVTVASVSSRDVAPAVDRELPVTLGMSPRMVFDALGRPIETIATLQGRRLVEYWLYRAAAGGVTRVAFQEGRVTSVQAR